ncbi:MAG: glycosyltransferase [Flavobacteriaceae bacterium]|nr:glycosyltransferase [Flavobacteriaceae bacterium]
MLSVIIPTFNSYKTFSILLDSIAQQIHKNVEVIVMDGMSRDNTIEIAEAYKSQIPGLKIFREKDNGIYDAMNKAMDKASGEWIIFLGSDDKFHSNEVLETLSETLKSSRAHVVYGNAKISGDTGWAKDGDIYDGKFDLPKLLNRNICHQAMFYRRSFIRAEIGTFNTDYKKSSDWDFNLRCWAKEPFEYVDLVISDFAAGGFSTHSNDTRIVDDFVTNVMRYFNIGLFHPLINRPTFIFYPKVVEKQKKEAPLRYKIQQLKRKLFKKLKL